ncbi:AI-2E family transporter [Raineyella sp. LH-20]|uniref:AI-2E family transporter n=1 Tax=Raineyella sp. LH-20 TaxID=3081204 RepID=UPI0029535574|nr:AI-2E family transporter [Raineyella sp. LH-20]WOP20146.1 AI-2E family transporter [Raineyella sp. LH-20]
MTSSPPGPPPSSIDEAVPRALRVAAAWGWRLIVLTVVGYGISWVLLQVPVLLTATMVALLLAVLLGPVALWLHRRVRLHRGLAAVISVLLAAAIAGGLLALVGQRIASGVTHVHLDLTGGVGQVQAWLSQGPLHLRPEQVQRVFSEIQNWISQHTTNLTQGAFRVGSSAVDTVVGTFLCLVTTVIFLADGRRIWTFLIGGVPLGERVRIDTAFRSGWRSLSAYIHTQFLVAALDAVLVGVGAAILGSPFAMAMAILVFVSAFVPVIGVVFGGGIAILATLVIQGWVAALVLLAIVVGVQQLESHVLQPFLMGRAVALHPLAVIFAVTAGSMMFGVVGALFAVPLLAMANAGIRTYAQVTARRRVRPTSPSDAPPARPGEPPVAGAGEPPVDGPGEPPVDGPGEPPVDGPGEPPVDGGTSAR